MTRNNIVKNVCSAFIARSGDHKAGRSLDRAMDEFFAGAAIAYHAIGENEAAADIAGFIAFELPKGYPAIEAGANAAAVVENAPQPATVQVPVPSQKVTAARA